MQTVRRDRHLHRDSRPRFPRRQRRRRGVLNHTGPSTSSHVIGRTKIVILPTVQVGSEVMKEGLEVPGMAEGQHRLAYGICTPQHQGPTTTTVQR